MQIILRTGGLAFLFFFICTAISAQKKLSSKAFHADFEQLQGLLLKYYPGLCHYETREQLDRRRDSLYAFGDSLSLLEAYRRLANFTSEIQDLHLATGLPKHYFGKRTRIFPLILRKFGDDFFIHYNQSGDSTLVRGTRILTINDMTPVADFYRFRTLYGADYGNRYSKDYYAERNFAGLYTRWYGQKDSVDLSYLLPGDSVRRSETLHYLLPQEASDNLNNRYKNVLRKNFSLELTDSLTRSAKLDITSFRGRKSFLNFTENKFRKQLKRSFKQIQADSVQNLLLDLRGNGGGAVVNVQRLISYLVSEPFRLYDTVYISKAGFRKVFKPYLGVPLLAGRLFFNEKTEKGYYRSYTTDRKKIKPARRYTYPHRLFVLMDGGSYSATTFTISLLKNQDRAIFVGTPPGGANWGSFAGQFYTARLKNSGIRVNIPLMKLVHSTEGLTHTDFFVQPDYDVQQSMADFLLRKDTAVEFIKEIIVNERN